MRVLAGAALRDVTPPPGLAMAGFAAREGPALGAHDLLTVRALAIDETAVLVADVIGIEAAMAARIRARCALPAEAVVVAASHTHGGPGSMRHRLRVPCDDAWLAGLEDACVAALDAAAAARRPARLSFRAGRDPGLAKNRRSAGGPVDRVLPCLAVRGADGGWIGVLASWACHPVVLGAANRLWTADYPQFLRMHLSAAFPGAVVLAATGCCGDVNTGHSAQASVSLTDPPTRSFAEAARLGNAIGAAILSAERQPVGQGESRCAEAWCDLPLRPADPAALAAEAAGWRAQLGGADAVQRRLLEIWLGWADSTARRPVAPVPARVTALRWGDVHLVALPGEIFAETALNLRAGLGERAFVLSYAEDNPGYIPPATAFATGGYEVEQAHRYYDMPTGFAAGAAELLESAARRALAGLGVSERQP